MKSILCVTILLSAGIPGERHPADSAAGRSSYAVIVNEKNGYGESGEAAKTLIKQLFLKELKNWPDGEKAKPFDQKGGSDASQAFQKGVLGMSKAQVARHWLNMKNRQGTTPPKSVSSDRKVVKYVAKYKGALGFVKAAAAKKKGVKVLFTF